MWDVSKDPVTSLIGLVVFCIGVIVITLVCQTLPERSGEIALVALLVYGLLSFGIFTDRFVRSSNK